MAVLNVAPTFKPEELDEAAAELEEAAAAPDELDDELAGAAADELAAAAAAPDELAAELAAELDDEDLDTQSAGCGSLFLLYNSYSLK